MTELQVTINNLKEVLIAGELILAKIEKAQKDLEKSPPHVWEHMDVFMNRGGIPMIYITGHDLPGQVFCIGACTGNHDVEVWLANAKFLFNLQEKI